MDTSKHINTVAVCPGSFDPVTNGHVDIIRRAAGIFDKVIVTIANNSQKTPLFTVEERKQLLIDVTATLPNVEVDSFHGLLIDYVSEKKANVIVKGLRTVSDFEYEMQMAAANHNLNPGIETFFVMANPAVSYLSSTIVKEIARYKGPIGNLVPEVVEQAVVAKMNKLKST